MDPICEAANGMRHAGHQGASIAGPSAPRRYSCAAAAASTAQDTARRWRQALRSTA